MSGLDDTTVSFPNVMFFKFVAEFTILLPARGISPKPTVFNRLENPPF